VDGFPVHEPASLPVGSDGCPGTVWGDFHRFLENISFCAVVFPARMGISKVEGLNSKIGGNGSPEASLPPVRYPRRVLTHPPATPSASLATNSYPEITRHS
jgi:hypothetical protein